MSRYQQQDYSEQHKAFTQEQEGMTSHPGQHHENIHDERNTAHGSYKQHDMHGEHHGYQKANVEMKNHSEHEHHHGHSQGTQAIENQVEHAGHTQPQSGHNQHAEHTQSHGNHNGHSGHGGHAGHSEAMFQRPFWISLILTIPVVIYSHMVQTMLGYHAPAFPGSNLIEPVLGSIIFWYGGWVFLRGAFDELRAKKPGMMTLVSLAISVAYLYSLAITFGLVQGMAFYWEMATLVTIMLLGHWMEMRAIGSAQSALRELAKLLPDMAERITPNGTEQVPVSELRENDLVLVRPGGQIPADAIVVEGESQVNESMITGESRPISKRPESEVIAGTVNSSGSLRLRVARTGEKTMLAGIMRLVEEAQQSRSNAQALADRAASWLTFVALGVALITLVLWTLAQGFNDVTLERVVTTLVVACPHALGLAIPLVIAISTTLSASNGILVRDRMALEQFRNISVVVFDKTGTLTEGKQGLVGITTQPSLDENKALVLTAAIEGDSEHIIARALVDAAKQRQLSIPSVSDFQSLAGRGVQANVEGQTLKVGGPRLLEQEGVQLPETFAATVQEWGKRGQTVVYLVEGQTVQAAFALADVIRPESRQAVASLKNQGIRIAMLTGDSQDVANWVASELGIDEVFAQVLPEHKSAKIKELQSGGTKVAMVGDGVNDAPALTQADVGIAIGAGTDVARASAGIVLVKNDPRDIVRIIALSNASYRKMVQNLAWAVGYNVIALPLAAGILAPWGIVLPAAVGAVLMSLSTIIVALNAQTLRTLKLQNV